MKYLLLIILFGITRISFATEQQPDKLEYENLKFWVPMGWGHPSPLQTYFYQNRLAYPFKSLSTANYRGHVASWKINDGKFYLTQLEIEEETPDPGKYQIKSMNDSLSAENGVFADWFSGVLQCIEYDDESDSYETKSIHYFQIRNGNVVAHEKFENRGAVKGSILDKMNRDYITFYYRLDNDRIVLNGKEGLLNTDVSRLSPVFDYYGKSILDWPYNWENQEKSGAPNCKWLIENERLYLTELKIQYGLMFDTIYAHEISLDKEFKTRKKTDRIFAAWVNGIYLVLHGKNTQDKTGYEYFETEKSTFIWVVKGIVKESVTVPGIFNTKNPPAETSEAFRKLLEDYIR
jgi:hypothetical protein